MSFVTNHVDIVQMNTGGDMPVLSNFNENAIRRGFIVEEVSSVLYFNSARMLIMYVCIQNGCFAAVI